MAHALLSPSSAKRWMLCPGSVAMTRELPDTKSDAADEGTAAHELASWALLEGKDAAAYVGRMTEIGIEATDDMAEDVQVYLDAVRACIADYELVGAKVTLYVEQAVPIGWLTGEDDATGTADVVIVAEFPSGDCVIHVWDLKFGRGQVVRAENNHQGQIYLLGAREELALIFAPTHFRFTIHQPRIRREPSEWEVSPAELDAFAEAARQRAALATLAMVHSVNWLGRADADQYLTPGDHCASTFCKAQATCPKLRSFALQTVADGFVDESQPIKPQIQHRPEATMDNAQLGEAHAAVEVVEAWCKAVRTKVWVELSAGRDVPGCKLILGREGNRKWGDADAVETALKSMRLKHDEMYTYKLISPAQAEKLLAKESPKRWAKLTGMVTRDAAKPTVVAASDPRPAYIPQPTADDFADESESLV